MVTLIDCLFGKGLNSVFSHLKNVRLGALCKRGHNHGGGQSYRHVGNGTCVSCQKEKINAWAKSPDGIVSLKIRKLKHKPKSVIRMCAYRKENSERISAYNRQYRFEHYDWFLAYYRNWNAKKKAVLANATPAWADGDAIKSFYDLAHFMSQSTGTEYEVDHIIPLISKRVCGLHVEANLRVITGTENRVKGNRWWPEGNEVIKELEMV